MLRRLREPHERHFHNAVEARAEGAGIAQAHAKSDGTYDAKGAARELLSLYHHLGHTQAERATVYAAALGAMPADAASNVALRVMGAIPPGKLDRIGRTGLAALRAANPGDAATAAIDRELRRRGPVKDIVVHGVHIVGDEVSERALEIAKGYVKKMTRTPEAAAALAGTRLVIIPHDERITDRISDLRAVRHAPAEDLRRPPVGPGARLRRHRRHEPHERRRGRRRRPGAPHRQEEDRRLRSPRFATLEHEFSHSVKLRYLDQLPATDPRLLALLPPGVTVDPSKKGKDVLEAAWHYRKTHHLIPEEYARANPDEWFAVAAEGYLVLPKYKPDERMNADWLERHDPRCSTCSVRSTAARRSRPDRSASGGGFLHQ